MLQKLRGNTKGFTLIELMIVIAIIGILAAIAIPNFIAYRNKSFCSKAESDANSTAGDIADFYAIPTNTICLSYGNLHGAHDVTPNNVLISCVGDDSNNDINITVADVSGRCPSDYKRALNAAANATGYWSASDSDVFVKIMRPHIATP